MKVAVWLKWPQLSPELNRLDWVQGIGKGGNNWMDWEGIFLEFVKVDLVFLCDSMAVEKETLMVANGFANVRWGWGGMGFA